MNRGADQVNALWEAGRNLSCDEAAADRRIFTFVDKNANGVVNETEVGFFDNSGEAISFELVLRLSTETLLRREG